MKGHHFAGSVKDRQTWEAKRRFLVGNMMIDLIIDIRAAREQGMPDYAAECERQVAALFKARHTVRLDSWGWPQLPEFQP